MEATRIKIGSYGMLLGLPALFVILSFWVGLDNGFYAFRGLRATVVFSYLVGIIYFLHKTGSIWIRLFLFFYALSSVLVIWYEHNGWGAFGMFSNAFAFMCLIRYLYPKIIFGKHSVLFQIAIIIGALINGWLMIVFLQVVYGLVANVVLFITICLSAAASFSVVVLAFFYNNQSITKASLYFIFFMLFLVFSETFRGAGHYGFMPEMESQYAARLLLVIAFAFLFGHLLSEHKSELL